MRRRYALNLLLVPWVAASVYYAKPLAGVVFGRESTDAFLARYVAFYADFRTLDSVLPTNAVLLTDFRLGASYAPRMPVWSAKDVPPGSAVYQFSKSCDAIVPSMTLGDRVEFTRSAVVTTYRTPGRAPEIGQLCVRAVLR